MNLSEWAHRQGGSYITAWRWFHAGILPVPARQLPTRTILVDEPAPEGRKVLYARVSTADQKDDLQRQVHRLRDWAREQGREDAEVVTEIVRPPASPRGPSGKGAARISYPVAP